MYADRAPTRRFFARIRAADFECPHCGEVYMVGQGRPSREYFDPRSGRFRCSRGCQRTFALGVIAWPVGQGAAGRVATPHDWVPTPEQALALRQELGFLAAGDDQEHAPDGRPVARGGRRGVNIVVRGECCCRVATTGRGRFVHPACPVHGGGD